MASAKPVVTYLDTSDFSAMLYDAAQNDHILRFLRDNIARERLIIGLSFVHFFEFLQRADQPFASDRLARANLLRELCGHWAFPYFMDLTDNSAVRNDCGWPPEDALALFDIERFVADIMKSLQRESKQHPELFPNRTSRRRLKDRQELKRLVLANPNVLAATTVSGTLFDRFFKTGVLRDYVLGKKSRQLATRSIQSSILDPAAIHNYWFEVAGNSNPITDDLKGLFAIFEIECRNFRIMLGKTTESVADLRKSESDLKRFGRHGTDLRKQLSLVRKGFEKLLSSPTSASQFTLLRGPGRTLVNEQYGAAMAAIVNARIRQEFNAQDSILGDVLHSLYLPFCDLWRGDRQFSSLLRNANAPHSKKIVERLRDLPSRIEALLSKVD